MASTIVFSYSVHFYESLGKTILKIGILMWLKIPFLEMDGLLVQYKYASFSF